MRSFVIILFTRFHCGDQLKKDGVDKACSTHDKMRNTREISVVKPERRGQLGPLGVDEKVLLKWILKQQYVRMRIGFIWLRIGISGGFLLTR
jgi:hypothetical protein